MSSTGRYEDYFTTERDGSEDDYAEFLDYPGESLGMFVGAGPKVEELLDASHRDVSKGLDLSVALLTKALSVGPVRGHIAYSRVDSRTGALVHVRERAKEPKAQTRILSPEFKKLIADTKKMIAAMKANPKHAGGPVQKHLEDRLSYYQRGEMPPIAVKDAGKDAVAKQHQHTKDLEGSQGTHTPVGSFPKVLKLTERILPQEWAMSGRGVREALSASVFMSTAEAQMLKMAAEVVKQLGHEDSLGVQKIVCPSAKEEADNVGVGVAWYQPFNKRIALGTRRVLDPIVSALFIQRVQEHKDRTSHNQLPDLDKTYFATTHEMAIAAVSIVTHEMVHATMSEKQADALYEGSSTGDTPMVALEEATTELCAQYYRLGVAAALGVDVSGAKEASLGAQLIAHVSWEGDDIKEGITVRMARPTAYMTWVKQFSIMSLLASGSATEDPTETIMREAVTVRRSRRTNRYEHIAEKLLIKIAGVTKPSAALMKGVCAILGNFVQNKYPLCSTTQLIRAITEAVESHGAGVKPGKKRAA